MDEDTAAGHDEATASYVYVDKAHESDKACEPAAGHYVDKAFEQIPLQSDRDDGKPSSSVSDRFKDKTTNIPPWRKEKETSWQRNQCKQATKKRSKSAKVRDRQEHHWTETQRRRDRR